MSPSESQLRAALQDGEGDAPDASLLIANALQVRRDRRHRITSIAGGVAVVAVVGVGLTALVSSGSGNDTAGGSSGGRADSAALSTEKAAGAAHAPAIPPGAAAGSSAQPSAFRGSSAVANVDTLKCPTTPARYMLPGGGGSGQFGSNDPLFPSAVAAIKVCGYPTGATAHPRTKIYQSPESSQIITALDSAPTTTSTRNCADNTYLRGTVEILAVDAKGRPLKPVVLTLNCQSSQATNGTAVRYVNAVPDQLVQLVQ